MTIAYSIMQNDFNRSLNMPRSSKRTRTTISYAVDRTNVNVAFSHIFDGIYIIELQKNRASYIAHNTTRAI